VALGFTFQGDSLSPSVSGPAISGDLGITIQGITTGGTSSASGSYLGAQSTPTSDNAQSTSGLNPALSSSPGLISPAGGLAVPGGFVTAGASSSSNLLLMLAALATIAAFVFRKKS
jgi:hypothetical protein